MADTPKDRAELVKLIRPATSPLTLSIPSAEAILTALEDAGVAEVPVEPTEAMVWAIHMSLDDQDSPNELYRAMLAASPYRERN